MTSTTWTSYMKSQVKQRPAGLTHNQWMSELGRRWRELKKQNQVKPTNTTTWRSFMTEQMKLKPPTIKSQDWLKEIGKRWQLQKAGSTTEIAIQTDEQPVDRQCSICMNSYPINSFQVNHPERYCSHLSSICDKCRCKMSKCPFCRKQWQDNMFDHEELRGIYDMYLSDIRSRIDHMKGLLFDLAPSDLKEYFNDFRLDILRDIEHKVHDEFYSLHDAINP